MTDWPAYLWLAVVSGWCPPLAVMTVRTLYHPKPLSLHVRFMVTSYVAGGLSATLGAGAALGIPQALGVTDLTISGVVVVLLAIWAALGIKGFWLLRRTADTDVLPIGGDRRVGPRDRRQLPAVDVPPPAPRAAEVHEVHEARL